MSGRWDPWTAQQEQLAREFDAYMGIAPSGGDTRKLAEEDGDGDGLTAEERVLADELDRYMKKPSRDDDEAADRRFAGTTAPSTPPTPSPGDAPRPPDKRPAMRRAGELTPALVEENERELEEAEAELARIEAEQETLLAETAADLAQGIISPGDAAARTKPGEERLHRAQTKAARLRLGVPELRRRLAEADAEQREREQRAAVATLDRVPGRGQERLGARQAWPRPTRAHAS